jgi:hypothetical protein
MDNTTIIFTILFISLPPFLATDDDKTPSILILIAKAYEIHPKRTFRLQPSISDFSP